MSIIRLSSLIALLLISACQDRTATHISAPRPFTLSFHAVVGDALADVGCATPLPALGASAVKGELLDLAFYVHGLAFVRADGSVIPAQLDENAWQSQDVALMDFQDRADTCSGEAKPTHTAITGMIPESEDIVAVRFTLGIPSHLNHVDPRSVKAPLNAANMFWSWQSGYKALRFDVSPEGGITRPDDPDFLGTNYFFHLGSTDCQGDALGGERVTCTRVNQPQIQLSGFELGSSAIVLDLAELVKGLDLRYDLAESPGCMSAIDDVECETYFRNLGLSLLSGSMDAGLSQTAFRLK